MSSISVESKKKSPLFGFVYSAAVTQTSSSSFFFFFCVYVGLNTHIIWNSFSTGDGLAEVGILPVRWKGKCCVPTVHMAWRFKVRGTMIFWRVPVAQYHRLQPSRFSIRVTSPLAPGPYVLPWEHGWTVFRGSHPEARAYSSPCLLMILSMDTWGIF